MEVLNAVVVLSLLAAFILPRQTTVGSTEKITSYGVLLDAGSTGTKLKIYSWRKPSSLDSLPQVTLSIDKRFRPGLSTFFGHRFKLKKYLKTILAQAQKAIPKCHHSKTRIYVMATAGMRYLKWRKAKRLLTITRRVLKAINPFAPIVFGDVDVISGEEEAIYGWIAVNYLLGFFSPKTSMKQSVGLLEMGGGSTQIAFIPDGSIYSEEFQVSLIGKLYSVYVQSYLQYGADGIAIKVADALRRKQPKKSQVDDPCSLKGDTSTIAFGDGTSIHVRGTSKPTRCKQILKEILEPATGVACQPKPCALGRVYQPSVKNITFYATGAYGYALQNVGALGPDGKFNRKTALEKVTAYCKKPLKEALELPNMIAKYASPTCLVGLYVPALLQTFGFPVDTDQVTITSKINSSKIDWTLGAVLVKLSKRHSTSKKKVFN